MKTLKSFILEEEKSKWILNPMKGRFAKTYGEDHFDCFIKSIFDPKNDDLKEWYDKWDKDNGDGLVDDWLSNKPLKDAILSGEITLVAVDIEYKDFQGGNDSYYVVKAWGPKKEAKRIDNKYGEFLSWEENEWCYYPMKGYHSR